MADNTFRKQPESAPPEAGLIGAFPANGQKAHLDAELQALRARITELEAAAERHLAETQRSEEQLHLQITGLEAAANGIAITDRRGVLLWVNPAFTTLTGYTADEVVGESLRVLKSGLQGAAFYQEMWQTILAGQVWRNEVINRRKDGSLYTEEMTITPVRDANGEISHFIAIKQDITERKEAETAPAKRAAELETV
ncbi:MAG: PAS domain S-box protein, partial [Chloroflexota bacterium]